MIYITTKRFKRKGIDGNFNIPYGTSIESDNGYLWQNGKRICSEKSAVIREYFARNDDGLGLKRSEITKSIIEAMLIRSGETKEDWQKRWDVLWEDAICNKYRKDYSETTFLWGIEFFNAPLLDLYHIAALAGVKVR